MKAARKLLRDVIELARVAGPAVACRFLLLSVVHFREVLRCGNLQPVDRAMADRDYDFRVLGHRVRVRGAMFSGARELYVRRVYFAVPELTLPRDGLVVDLGANCGIFSVLAACAGCRVIAIEAQRSFLAEIAANARENRCTERVRATWGIVGADTGVFAEGKQLLAANSGERPPAFGLSELLRAEGDGEVEFLKVDIEGSEFALFAGDVGWLRRVRQIAMEIHPRFGDAECIAEVLRQAGFAVALADDTRVRVDRIPPAGGYLYAWRTAQRAENASRQSVGSVVL